MSRFVGSGGGGVRGALAWVAVVLVLSLVTGCAGRGGAPSEAVLKTEGVRALLERMSSALAVADRDALADLWQGDLRDPVRERAAVDLARTGPGEVSFELLGLKLAPGRVVARVAWRGDWDGVPREGRFDLDLSGGDSPLILALRGDDPARAPEGRPVEGLPLPGR